MRDRPQNQREDQTAASALHHDFQDYAHYVRDYDLSETQKRELVTAIWSIMVSFVDLRFGVHPIQQASDLAKMLETDSPGMLALECISQNTDETIAVCLQDSTAVGEDS